MMGLRFRQVGVPPSANTTEAATQEGKRQAAVPRPLLFGMSS